MKKKNAISPTRDEDYSAWYGEIIKQAELADHSPVRGSMIIRPWGYAIWENIKRVLDSMIKETGHQNAYFPLFIPLSFFEKEAKHVDGFAKECAVVTHHRLEKNEEGGLSPAGELEEPLVVRPTSEMIIGASFSNWVQSYRDLPLLINQWANIVRWEMRTRMFLRTTEVLWQEGHTVHATEKEAMEETKKMLDVYSDFCHQYLAMPVIKSEKTESERFPGAVNTYSIEAMMQDKRALQAGTSHFLGQNFSKASNIKYSDEAGALQYAWTTSWGVATRLIGGLIMTHSDDDGLVLPPRLAPKHIVILPLIHKKEMGETVVNYCMDLKKVLESIEYDGKTIEVELDNRDIRGGEKKWGWIKKGVPLVVEVGMRDIENENICFIRRDKISELQKEKRKDFLHRAASILEDMQNNLLFKANKFLCDNIKEVETKEDFYSFFSEEKPQGFIKAPFCLDSKIEEQLKQDLSVTTRGIPLDEVEDGDCIFTGTANSKKVIFAKAY